MSELQDRLQVALGAAYRIERELGGGGMSRVFLAEETQLARKVVLKLLPPELSRGVSADRFRREIQLAASLQHPHVVPLLAAGQSGDLFWYSMPFIEGESLRTRIAREGELPVPEVTRLLRDVADALDYAHHRGIVHRDIKPDNVLLTGGHAVVTDFGVAKAISASTAESSLTSVGMALGTPAYMAPEQASGDPHVDHRADLYALGALAYEMLAGSPPFAGNPQAILAAQVTQAPVSVVTHRSAVPAALAAMVMRCLEKKPADRFQSAREVVGQLEAITSTGGMAPTSAIAPARRPAISAGRRYAVAAVIVLLLAGGFGAVKLLGSKGPKVIASAARIAVMPFVPASPDTALARLGRDLVVTLTANLEGVGDIQTVDALSVLAQARDRTLALADGAALARRLGASSFVHGSLLRDGSRVRLDLGLFTADSASPVARTSVTAAPDDVTALTDSTTWALLRQVWRARRPPTPNVASVTTQSIPALRAFLEGEQAIARANWRSAAEAFSRAIAADSTFWLAYWRYQYSRVWIFEPVDSSIRAAVVAHRAEFPERDRLLAEGKSREVTEKFPDYWPGWMALGDALAHGGGMQGRLPAEAIAALEQTASLNPTFLPAWEHLFWMSAVAMDTARVRQVHAELVRLGYGAEELGYDGALLNRYVAHLTRHDGQMNAALADSNARSLAGSTIPVVIYTTAALGSFGFLAAQHDLNERILRLRSSGLVPEAAVDARAALLAGRGAWDSALAVAGRRAAAESSLSPALESYAMALSAAWLELLPLADAARTRPNAGRLAKALPRELASLGWLDGLAAYLAQDRAGAGRARNAVAGSGAPNAQALATSVGGFELALAGRSREAADSLTSTSLTGLAVPASALAQMLAARWLLASGDTTRAVAKLRFPLSMGSGMNSALNLVALGSLALRELARIAEARGERELARLHYRQFLIRYDLPAAAHKPWVEQAQAALAR